MINSDFIEIMPIANDPLFEQRESDRFHTAYDDEVEFFSCIARGDVEGVKKNMDELKKGGIVVGRMSRNSLRQMQYWAVCCATLAARYAIKGGYDETRAYNFSDECIRTIDNMMSADEIFPFMWQKCIELTQDVSKNECEYSSDIKKCMHIISSNLHKKLTVEQIAHSCNLSADYLSFKFKKEVGIRLSEYIKEQKLVAAAEMLKRGTKCCDVAFYLAFSSESYFIKCFKAEYGVTPGKYI